MKLLERSYSGKVFRPRPEILCEAEGNLCLIATPWGPRSAARKVIQTIVDFFHSARANEEATSPFQPLSGLSPMANNLRVAIMLANDTVFREENRNEFLSGVELFAAAKRGHELAWAHIGGPHLLLDRPGLDLQVLSTTPDYALLHTDQKELLAPLPGALLGLGATSNFAVQSIRVQNEDRLILLHRSFIPPIMQTLPRPQRQLGPFSQIMAKQSADLPFWLGILSFEAA